MWKKTLLALATVVALAGFGTLVESSPAAAQGMHHYQPRMQAHAPRHWGGVQHVPRGYYRPPPHRWHGPRHWHGPRYGSGVWFSPPGLYAGYAYSDCRIVRKRVRVWTDDGWDYRWRRYRYCG
jgi:hypothetical protein